jgi:hypothetical protein
MQLTELVGFHDSELWSVQYFKVSNTLELRFKDTGQEDKLISLLDCRLFRVADMGKQNVVSRLICISGAESDTAYVAERLSWASSLSDTASYLDQHHLHDLIGGVSRSELCMIVLEPSWGAELVAICRGTEVLT